MNGVSGIKDNERQKALIARINARILEGAHKGKPGETTMYFLDECMQLEAEGLAYLNEIEALKQKNAELKALLDASNLGWA